MLLLMLMLMLMSLFVNGHYVCSSVAGWPPGLEKLGRPRKVQAMLLLMLLMLMLLMLMLFILMFRFLVAGIFSWYSSRRHVIYSSRHV